MEYHKIWVYNGLTFFLVYMQPNIVGNLMATVSCRAVAGVDYINADIRYICYDDTHYFYMVAVVVPPLIIWAFIIPLLNLRGIHKNRTKLNNVLVRFRYGMLFHLYKKNFYYWEFIRAYMKMTMASKFSFYNFQTS